MAAADPLDEEDFRSRSAVGMPADLARRASDSLAAEDLAIGKVNAVSRAETPWEGYARVARYQEPGTEAATRYPAGAGKIDYNAGTVTGSIPVFRTSTYPRADLGISDAMDRTSPPPRAPTLADAHVDDITQRRAQIDDALRQVKAKLGVILPKEAGFAAMVLAPPKDHPDLLHQWSALENESRNLLREHQAVAADATKTAHENATRDLHIQSANGKAKILNGLADLNQQYPVDSQEYRLAALKLFGSNDPEVAAARGSSDFEALVRPFIDHHDRSVATAESIKQARENFTAGTGLEPESVELTAAGGINIRAGSTKPAKEVPDAVMRDYTALKVARAAETTHLGYAPDEQSKKDIQKKIDILDSQLGAVHEQFPSLVTRSTTAPPVTTATPPPNITAEAHAALKSGDKFWWNGKQLTKK